MAESHGTIGRSFGHFIWSRENKSGTPESLLLADKEFWELWAHDSKASHLAADVEAIGGPTRDGRPHSAFVIASPRTDRARDQVYRHMSKRIAEALARNESLLRDKQSRLFRFAAEDRNWMVALDVFGIHRNDFHFSKLENPFAGIVLTLDMADRNAATGYDASKSIAIDSSQIASVEGQGSDWTIRLRTGDIVELSRERGLHVGKLASPSP